MKEEERKNTLDRYNERFKLYGYDPKTLGWLKGKQEIRFQVLSEIGYLNDCSFLDVGCGFGDLFGFLRNKGICFEYTGIDINQNLLNTGRKLFPLAQFIEMDFDSGVIDRKFDWVFASGIFNFKLEDNDQFIKNMLKKMVDTAVKGVAVDFMSSYVDFQNESAFHAEPEKIFSYSKKLSKRVMLRHDYMPFEFCIYIYKDDRYDERTVFNNDSLEYTFIEKIKNAKK